jgi:hypothetical protein
LTALSTWRGPVHSAFSGGHTDFVEVLPVFLKLGQSVNLEMFSSFRVSVSSEGTATPEELNARHIGCKVVVFTARRS